MHFVFVHGWGFNAAIWRDLIGFMRTSEVSLVDLGFIAGGPPSASAWPRESIAVGHSLGALWLLHRVGERGNAPFRGLVSIQGFDRFCPPIPTSRVAGMRRGLRRDPGRTLDVFWQGCGTEPFAPPGALNVERAHELEVAGFVGQARFVFADEPLGGVLGFLHAVFLFEQHGAYVVRILLGGQAGGHHDLAEFTKDDVDQLLNQAPLLRAKPTGVG